MRIATLLLYATWGQAAWAEDSSRTAIHTSSQSLFHLPNGDKALVEAINSSSQALPIQCNAPAELKVFTLYKETDIRPGVRVAYCSSEGGGHSSDGGGKGGNIAICLPALHAPSKRFAEQRQWQSVQSWISRFKTYYSSLGVSHFYMYSVGKTVPIDTTLSGGGIAGSSQITWIDMSWVRSYYKTSQRLVGKQKSISVTTTNGLWYNGQVWAMNDCLYRNKQLTFDGSKRQSNRYVFFTDYDEIFDSFYKSNDLKSFLFSSEYMRGLALAPRGSGTAVSRNNQSVEFDSVSLGQYISYSSSCPSVGGGASDGGAPLEDWAKKSTCGRAKSDRPECIRSGLQKNRTAEVEGWFMCGTWRGRRKHIDNARTVYLTTVHTVKECPNRRLNCVVYTVNAQVAWLNHYRSSVFNDTGQCICHPPRSSVL